MMAPCVNSSEAKSQSRNTRLFYNQAQLDCSVREHGGGDFFEAGDIGAVDVVDSAVLYPFFDAVVVDVLHDRLEP